MPRTTLAAFAIALASIAPGARAEVPFRHTVVDEHAGTQGVDINVAGDLNGDGLDDLIVAAKGGEVVWYENPSLARHEIFKADFKWSCEGEVADVDGDRDNDLVLVSWYESKHYWLENPGSGEGTWTLHTIGGGIRGHDVEVADLDEDGRLDVIVRSETWPRIQASAREIQIWRQDGPDRWTERSVRAPEGGGILAADVDRDGDKDLLIGGRWYENDGRGIAEGAWAEHVIDPDATTYNKIELADLNGDFRKDVVITPSETHAAFPERGPVAWYEAPVDARQGTWTKHVVEDDMGDLHSLAVADIDNDGSLDIFTAKMHNARPPLEVLVYLNRGKGQGWTRQVVATTGTHEAQLLDLGGDGDDDLFGTNYKTNRPELWENLLNKPGAERFVFFDRDIVHTGQRRLWEDWDFVTKMDPNPGAPKDWVAPVNFADGTLHFRVEVKEMGPVDSPVSIHMGWESIPNDPEIRHTAGAPIVFSKPDVYETTVPIRSIKVWYGKGPRVDQRCYDWDWRHAFTENKFYTFIQPRKNPPGKDGFPYKVHATVTILAPGAKPVEGTP